MTARARTLRRVTDGWSVRAALRTSHPVVLLLPVFAYLVLATLVFPDRPDDESGYIGLAHDLLDGRFSTGDALLDPDRAYPDLWFGPGLPLLLLVPVALDLPLELIRLVGPLFLCLALIVFLALMRLHVSRRAAIAATYLLGLYLPFSTVLTNVHSEPPAVLFVVVAMYAVAHHLAEGGRRWLVLGGGAFAALALTRVDYGWVLTIVLAALLVWWACTRDATPRRVASMCALGLALCIPWLVYTTAETGRLAQWGTSGSLSLYWMSSPYPGDLGDWQQANAVLVDPDLAPHKPFFERLEGLPLARQNAELERAALNHIRDNPAKFAENVAANLSRMFFDVPYSYTEQRASALYFALPNALLLSAVVFAAVVAVRVRGALPPPTAPFLLFGATSLALHAVVAAYPRMLMPIVPVMVWFVVVVAANHVRVATRDQDGARPA